MEAGVRAQYAPSPLSTTPTVFNTMAASVMNDQFST